LAHPTDERHAVPTSRFSLASVLAVGMASMGMASGHTPGLRAEPAAPPASSGALATGAPLANGAALTCDGDDPGPDPVRLETARLRGDRYVADRASGALAELTLDPRLQAATERLLHRSQIMYGASVLLSIPDGRVLALAGRSSVDPSAGANELALRPWAPAASVFKLVSAAALVEEAGLTADTRACYHGGVSSLRRDNLVDNPRLDRCASLAYGIGKSQNAILAKLAIQHLSPGQLERTGHALGFEEALAFDLPVEPSHLDVPEGNPLEFARTAAGFWHSTLSPLHGALLASAIADGGRMVTPYLVDRRREDPQAAADAALDAVAAAPVPEARQVLTPEAAAQVAQMMAGVTRMGTAHKAFYDRAGRPRLPFSAAGKTGTLYGKADRGFVGYSWFVGFAPVEHPTVAFAVVLGNRPGYQLRASEVARQLLAEYAAANPMPPRTATTAALR
jgi:cell division protein FtsI/penicillin-binding protein 2